MVSLFHDAFAEGSHSNFRRTVIANAAPILLPPERVPFAPTLVWTSSEMFDPCSVMSPLTCLLVDGERSSFPPPPDEVAILGLRDGIDVLLRVSGMSSKRSNEIKPSLAKLVTKSVIAHGIEGSLRT